MGIAVVAIGGVEFRLGCIVVDGNGSRRVYRAVRVFYRPSEYVASRIVAEVECFHLCADACVERSSSSRGCIGIVGEGYAAIATSPRASHVGRTSGSANKLYEVFATIGVGMSIDRYRERLVGDRLGNFVVALVVVLETYSPLDNDILLLADVFVIDRLYIGNRQYGGSLVLEVARVSGIALRPSASVNSVFTRNVVGSFESNRAVADYRRRYSYRRNRLAVSDGDVIII